MESASLFNIEECIGNCNKLTKQMQWGCKSDGVRVPSKQRRILSHEAKSRVALNAPVVNRAVPRCQFCTEKEFLHTHHGGAPDVSSRADGKAKGSLRTGARNGTVMSGPTGILAGFTVFKFNFSLFSNKVSANDFSRIQEHSSKTSGTNK